MVWTTRGQRETMWTNGTGAQSTALLAARVISGPTRLSSMRASSLKEDFAGGTATRENVPRETARNVLCSGNETAKPRATTPAQRLNLVLHTDQLPPQPHTAAPELLKR